MTSHLLDMYPSFRSVHDSRVKNLATRNRIEIGKVEYLSADIEEIRKVLSLPEEEFVRRQVRCAR